MLRCRPFRVLLPVPLNVLQDVVVRIAEIDPALFPFNHQRPAENGHSSLFQARHGLRHVGGLYRQVRAKGRPDGWLGIAGVFQVLNEFQAQIAQYQESIGFLLCGVFRPRGEREAKPIHIELNGLIQAADLAGLMQHPRTWMYGYELSKPTGLKSGTLYPLLMRLSDQGLLEDRWRGPLRPGRPPRHVCRLCERTRAMKILDDAVPTSAYRTNALGSVPVWLHGLWVLAAVGIEFVANTVGRPIVAATASRSVLGCGSAHPLTRQPACGTCHFRPSGSPGTGWL